jgi:hypothetical protein
MLQNFTADGTIPESSPFASVASHRRLCAAGILPCCTDTGKPGRCPEIQKNLRFMKLLKGQTELQEE